MITPEQFAEAARLDREATQGPFKVSTYRPNNVIARDPKESTYEVGDDKFQSLGYFDRIQDGRAFAFFRNHGPQARERIAELEKFTKEAKH